MICKNCNNEISDFSAFCPYCGMLFVVPAPREDSVTHQKSDLPVYNAEMVRKMFEEEQDSSSNVSHTQTGASNVQDSDDVDDQLDKLYARALQLERAEKIAKMKKAAEERARIADELARKEAEEELKKRMAENERHDREVAEELAKEQVIPREELDEPVKEDSLEIDEISKPVVDDSMDYVFGDEEDEESISETGEEETVEDAEDTSEESVEEVEASEEAISEESEEENIDSETEDIETEAEVDETEEQSVAETEDQPEKEEEKTEEATDENQEEDKEDVGEDAEDTSEESVEDVEASEEAIPEETISEAENIDSEAEDIEIEAEVDETEEQSVAETEDQPEKKEEKTEEATDENQEEEKEDVGEDEEDTSEESVEDVEASEEAISEESEEENIDSETEDIETEAEVGETEEQSVAETEDQPEKKEEKTEEATDENQEEDKEDVGEDAGDTSEESVEDVEASEEAISEESEEENIDSETEDIETEAEVDETEEQSVAETENIIENSEAPEKINEKVYEDISEVTKHNKSIAKTWIPVAGAVLIVALGGYAVWSHQPSQMYSKISKIAAEAYQNGNYLVAEEQYSKLSEYGALDVEMYTNLADSYINTNQHDDAVSILKKALAEYPDDKALSSRLEEIYPSVQISPAIGTYNEPIVVELASSGVDIYYSIYGSCEAGDNIKYDSPFTLDENGEYTIDAYCKTTEGYSGPTNSVTYVIDIEEETETVSEDAESDIEETQNDSGEFDVAAEYAQYPNTMIEIQSAERQDMGEYSVFEAKVYHGHTSDKPEGDARTETVKISNSAWLNYVDYNYGKIPVRDAYKFLPYIGMLNATTDENGVITQFDFILGSQK